MPNNSCIRKKHGSKFVDPGLPWEQSHMGEVIWFSFFVGTRRKDVLLDGLDDEHGGEGHGMKQNCRRLKNYHIITQQRCSSNSDLAPHIYHFLWQKQAVYPLVTVLKTSMKPFNIYIEKTIHKKTATQ